MLESIDKTNFTDLLACDPDEIVTRTGCDYDAETRQYYIKVWGYGYTVDPDKRMISPDKGAPGTYKDFLYLFIVFYLIKVSAALPSGEWVSEKDIPGGAGFFRGPHLLPVDLITETVEDDLDRFNTICRSLGGTPIEMADAAFSFQITPLIPVAVLYWQGDEDFPAEAKLLFDRSIKDHLPLDIIFALAVEICHAFNRKNVVD